MPKDDDPQGQLVADRIAVLERSLEKYTGMLANLQGSEDSNAYRHIMERVEAVVAELEKLRAPEPKGTEEPEDSGMPTHAKFTLGATGAAVLAVGGGEWFLGVVAAGLAATAYVFWRMERDAD